ncbi:MAG: hypothetical protein ACJAW3_000768, partial [Lentimonas sp.]
RNIDAGQLEEITQDEQEKIVELFRKKRYEIAKIISQPEGVEKLLAAAFSNNDGCVANVSTQFERGYLSMMIDDVADKLIYQFFTKEITEKIFDNGDDNLGNNEDASELNNPVIHRHRILGDMFFKKMEAFVLKQNFSKLFIEDLRRNFGNEDLVEEINGEIFYDYDSIGKISTHFILERLNQFGLHQEQNPMEHVDQIQMQEADDLFSNAIAKSCIEYLDKPLNQKKIIEDNIALDTNSDSEEINSSVAEILFQELDPANQDDLRPKEIALYLLTKRTPELKNHLVEGLDQSKIELIQSKISKALDQARTRTKRARVEEDQKPEGSPKSPNSAGSWMTKENMENLFKEKARE